MFLIHFICDKEEYYFIDPFNEKKVFFLKKSVDYSFLFFFEVRFKDPELDVHFK